jgi:hypothetical protein
MRVTGYLINQIDPSPEDAANFSGTATKRTVTAVADP